MSALTAADNELAGLIIAGMLALCAVAGITIWVLSCVAEAMRGHRRRTAPPLPDPDEIGGDIHRDGTPFTDAELDQLIRSYFEGGRP